MYASGNGLGQLARRWAHEGRLESVVAINEDIDSIRGEHLSQAVAAGHADALAALDEFATHVAVGLTNLMYVLDPAAIVIGGGLVEIGEPLRSAVQTAVSTTTLGGSYRPDVPVLLAELGNRSAALGAAILAREIAQ